MKKVLIIVLLLVLGLGVVSRTKAMAAKSETAQERVESLRELRQSKLESLGAIREEYREDTRNRREAYQEKIQEIKDERKQLIAEWVNNQLAHVNEKATNAMMTRLTKMRALLNKLADRMAKAKGDTTAVEAAIAAAEEAITTAEGIVEEQAGKEYVIEFEAESGLKAGASEAKTSLRADLKTARDSIHEARQAVVEALKSAKTMQQQEAGGGGE